ncbi:MAG: hypothetical protein JWN70_1503, partial [Planctomycetaceae bacterium]|nr:hypothetical protein [Planctomycetaceae bacterium]
MTVFGPIEKATPIRNLARRRAALLQKAGSQSAAERLQILNSALKKADQLDSNGQRLEAENIWDSVKSLYDGNVELDRFVKYAKARRTGKSRTEAAQLLEGNTPEATTPEPDANPNPNE